MFENAKYLVLINHASANEAFNYYLRVSNLSPITFYINSYLQDRINIEQKIKTFLGKYDNFIQDWGFGYDYLDSQNEPIITNIKNLKIPAFMLLRDPIERIASCHNFSLSYNIINHILYGTNKTYTLQDEIHRLLYKNYNKFAVFAIKSAVEKSKHLIKDIYFIDYKDMFSDKITQTMNKVIKIIGGGSSKVMKFIKLLGTIL